MPTLVLHRTGDLDAQIDEGRYLAARIPGARFVELAGDDHVPFVEPDQVLDEVEEFLTGVRPGSGSPIACWPPCSSPISWARPSGRRSSGTPA